MRFEKKRQNFFCAFLNETNSYKFNQLNKTRQNYKTTEIKSEITLAVPEI